MGMAIGQRGLGGPSSDHSVRGGLGGGSLGEEVEVVMVVVVLAGVRQVRGLVFFYYGYVPLGDDQFGGGVVSPHQLYPYFSSPDTMERQLGGEVCYSELAAIWVQEDGEGSNSQPIVGTPKFHVDPNEPATGFHDMSHQRIRTMSRLFFVHIEYHDVEVGFDLGLDSYGYAYMGASSSSVVGVLAQTAPLGMIWVHFIHVCSNPRGSWTSHVGPPYGGQNPSGIGGLKPVCRMCDPSMKLDMYQPSSFPWVLSLSP
ncbi:hypothetical protein PIB30_022539 [Stylosanthes scabra]|uniref:Uncharacterized protein n=1 Tax=Stylosanthes scabra TaxID=79078 RepID=A0ABU6W771_9FABA|nr:hypothetical protein [Stylosanthes scabra]